MGASAMVIKETSVSPSSSNTRIMLRKLKELWESTQVELHGRYSPDRVHELAKYSREASWVRVVSVLLATPLPCLVVTVLIDVLPLADPSEGINTNYMFIVREFYCYLVMNFLSIQQFRTSVPTLSYPIRRSFGNAIILTILCVAVFFGFASTIGFPVPFSIVTVMPAWVSMISISMAIEWSKQIREIPGARTMVGNVVKVWLCEVLLVLVYPPYFYIFTILPNSTQMGFALLLPAIKILMRNIFARTVVHLRDNLPEVVIFNVEVFNALFVSYCMQNSPSIGTTLELMLADIVLLMLSLRDMHDARRSLESLASRIERDASSNFDRGRSCQSVREVSAKTLQQASILLRDETNPQFTLVSPFNSLSSYQPQGIAAARSVEATTRSKSVIRRVKDACNTFVLALQPLSARQQRFDRGRVHPLVRGMAAPGRGSQKIPVKLLYTRKVRRLLYMAEFLLLLNYVEVVIPLVFSIYLYAMYQLPNRDYYAQLVGMNQDQLLLTLKNVLFYCSLQLISLLVLALALKRMLGLSPIRQLAFVLEKQFAGAQIKLIFWVLYNVQASLKHSGYDYTFEFGWLRGDDNAPRGRVHHGD